MKNDRNNSLGAACFKGEKQNNLVPERGGKTQTRANKGEFEQGRDGFVFYRSFHDATKDLPAESYKEILLAIITYALDEVIVEMPPVIKAMFMLAKTNLDRAKTRYTAAIESGKKGEKAGNLGGNPNFKKGQANPYYPKKDNPLNGYPNNDSGYPRQDNSVMQDNSLITPTLPLNVNVNDNVNDSIDCLSDSLCAPTREDMTDGQTDKKNAFYLESMEYHIRKLGKDFASDIEEPLMNICREIIRQKEMTIGGVKIPALDVIHTILGLLRDKDGFFRAWNKAESAANAQGVKNRFRYKVSMLYNEARGV